MALNYTSVDVPFTGGLAENLDPRLVPMGAWLSLKNCRRNSDAGFNKRFGTTSLNIAGIETNRDTDLSSPAVVTSPVKFTSIGNYNGSLIGTDGKTFYQYSELEGIFRSKSSTVDSRSKMGVASVDVSHKAFLSIANKINSFDWCLTPDNTIQFVAEVVLDTPSVQYDSNNPVTWGTGILQAVCDTNGNFIQGPSLLRDSSQNIVAASDPRVLYVNGNVILTFMVWGVSNMEIHGLVKSNTKQLFPADISTAITIAPDVFGSPGVYDICSYKNNQFLIGYSSYGIPFLGATVVKVVSNTLVTATTTRSSPQNSPYYGIAIRYDSVNDKVYHAFTAESGGFMYAYMGAWNSAWSEATPYGAGSPGTVVSGAGIPTTNGSGKKIDLIFNSDFSKGFSLQSNAGEFSTVDPDCTVGIDVNPDLAFWPFYSRRVSNYLPISRCFNAVDGKTYCLMRDLVEYNSASSTPKKKLLASCYLIDVNPFNHGNKTTIENFLSNPNDAGYIAALNKEIFDPPNYRVATRGPMRELRMEEFDLLQSYNTNNVIIIGNKVLALIDVQEQLNSKLQNLELVTYTWNKPNNNDFLKYGQHVIMQPMETYDGNRVVEMGFNSIPSAPSAFVQQLNGGAGIGAGTYAATVVWKYVNASGEVLRSSPSPATTVVAAAAGDTFVVGMPPMAISQMFNINYDIVNGAVRQGAVIVEIYRTPMNGQTFYLMAEAPANISNGGLAYSVKSTMLDSELIGKPVLYTGSAANNFSPPNLTCMKTWQNRLVGLGPDKRTIWISNEYIVGQAPIFNEKYNVSIDADLTGIGVVDDKLFAMSAEKTYYLVGQPADSLGNNSTLTPYLLSAQLGCADARSIVDGAQGVIFRTQRSFAMIGRNIDIKEIGLPVQDKLVDYPITTSGTLVDRDQEIRWTVLPSEGATTGVVVVFSLIDGSWSINTYYDGINKVDSVGFIDSIVYNGIWFGLTALGSVLREDTTAFTDSGKYVPMELTTPWIHVEAVGNFLRLKRIEIQAEHMSPHDVSIKIANNYNDSVVQSLSISDTLISTFKNLPIEELLIYPTYQKTKAVSITIKDQPPTSSNLMQAGEGFRLFGLTLRLAPKVGVGKTLPSNQKT